MAEEPGHRPSSISEADSKDSEDDERKDQLARFRLSPLGARFRILSVLGLVLGVPGAFALFLGLLLVADASTASEHAPAGAVAAAIIGGVFVVVAGITELVAFDSRNTWYAGDYLAERDRQIGEAAESLGLT